MDYRQECDRIEDMNKMSCERLMSLARRMQHYGHADLISAIYQKLDDMDCDKYMDGFPVEPDYREEK